MALNKVSTSLHYVKRPQSSSLDSSETYWVPNTDVYVTEGGLVIKVELAGMRKEDLEVLMVDGNRLKISGHRPDGCRAPKCTFLVMEINYGAFESVIELPSGYDLSQAKATYQNGFLRIDVPEQAPSSQKSISVSIPSGES
ncbi:MAG: heat-shock protein Hsp20 [Verrucomicrobia bacterium]|nr:MAG: heat-shock protein Hsp20 [Verrucomicrobiota bacterium]